MDRIIIHWTAGTHKVSDVDRQHYHFIIDGAGNVVAGKYAPEANAKPVAGKYAAHTLNANTGAIGVAVAAMLGAQERPFSAGKYPITTAQVDALARLVVKICDQYGIPITGRTVLTHAEVQPVLGIAQRGKWDITWLPGMTGAGDPVAVGNAIRDRARALRVVTPDPVTANPFAAIVAWLKSIFGGLK